MDARFNDLFTHPENSVFRVVFYPDRIYHAAYLNATRSRRYRYNVQEVRNQLDIGVLKGEVYLDGERLTNFLRIEYRASRLVEQAREKLRFLRGELLGWVRVRPEGAAPSEATLKLHYCPWVDAYQVEVWETLEPPPGKTHDFSVLDLMGRNNSITRVKAFGPALQDIRALRQLEVAFRENDRDLPFGWQINNPEWDNNYLRSHQEPTTPDPSSPLNTIADMNYFIDFRRGWFLQADDFQPVRYRNAMMNVEAPERDNDNIIEMRWYCSANSAALWSSSTRSPSRPVEGTHRHIGTEELYYVVYNHTGEGGVASNGTVARLLSFRGLDNSAYYELDADPRFYINNNGVGPNLNAAHPRVRQLTIDSLAYWKDVLGVDGYRFDLASVLGNTCQRDCFNFNKFDPDNILNRAVKELPVRPEGGGDGVDLIAEAWGIGDGTYQVGQFPHGWAEWNDKFRDAFRTSQNRLGIVHVPPAKLARRFAGSSDLFQDDGRKPWHSVNFIVSHDGFSLRDLYAFKDKQNHQPWPFGPSDGGSTNNLRVGSAGWPGLAAAGHSQCDGIPHAFSRGADVHRRR